MRKLVSIAVILALALTAAPPVQSQSQPNQLLQGTQIKLVLLHGLSTSVARAGDPFTAMVTEPVYLGSQLILPAGARVHGEVGNIIRPKRFAMFRGQAAMNLHFRVIQVEQVEVPAAMSILSIHQTQVQGQAEGKRRSDLRTEEGVMVEAKTDVKRSLATAALATGGGTLVGAIFSHALRGFTFGLIGGTAYVLARKGKEVELPAQTGLIVRMDNTVTLPVISGAVVGAQTGQP